MMNKVLFSAYVTHNKPYLNGSAGQKVTQGLEGLKALKDIDTIDLQQASDKRYGPQIRISLKHTNGRQYAETAVPIRLKKDFDGEFDDVREQQFLANLWTKGVSMALKLADLASREADKA